MARRDAALNNIRSLMESQEVEWLGEHGFDPVPHRPEPRRSTAPKKPLSGQFAANRFIGAAPTEPQAPHEDKDSGGVEVVEVIKQKDNRHSWLYNEVVKAIRDASGDGKKTKVIAIFIPVVQNGKEFEELPVSESIELSPVEEEAITLDEDDFTPAPNAEDSNDLTPASPYAGEEPDTLAVTDAGEELETPDEQVGDLLPEPVHEPDEELAQAFIDMEAKLDEDIAAESQELPDIEELTESDEATEVVDTIDDIVDEAAETFADVEEPEDYSAGEALEFTEIPLPIELDDDEVFGELGELDEPDQQEANA